MAVQRISTIYTHFHTKIDALDTSLLSFGASLKRAGYRLPLLREPDEAVHGMYFVRALMPERHRAGFGTGENIWVATFFVELGYFRGGGDADEGDRLSVAKDGQDDAMTLADVIENPNTDGYNSTVTGIQVITFEGVEAVGERKHADVYATRFRVRWRSDVIE